MFRCCGSIWLKWMTQVSCHKCRQALPHESDSWCLGCSAVEALSLELRNIWGSPGTRAVATDIICSGLRQVRALRRLGVGGAGGSRASLTSPLCGVSPGSLPPPEPTLPPKAVVEAPGKSPARATEVKEEQKEDSEESGEETSSGGEAHAGASAKSKAEPLQPLPRRRSGGEGRGDEAEHPKESEPAPRLRSRSRKRDRESSVPERRKEKKEKKRRSSGHLSRSCKGNSPKRGESGVHREEGGRRRAHRGGTRHQRLYRAAEDPYRRFHQKRPEGYWDQEFRDFR